MNLEQYALNRHARVALTITTPVRGESIRVKALMLNEEGAFLRAFREMQSSGVLESLQRILAAENLAHCEVPEEHVRQLVDLGLLLPADQLSAYPLYQPTLPTANGPVPEGLVTNPALVLQQAQAPPDQLVWQVPYWDRLSPHRPLLWARHPLSRCWFPYWLSPEQLDQLQSQAPGPEHPLAAALFQAGALIPALSGRAAWLEGLRSQLAEQGYLVLRGLLPPVQQAAMSRHVSDLAAEGFFQNGDPMVPLRNTLHNEVVTRFLHLQFTGLLREILYEAIHPSYAFLSTYVEGAVLQRHTDRSQCNWNMSLVLDARQPPDQPPQPWPIWLETPNGPSAVDLAPGDAVLYAGARTHHWRDPLPAGHQVTVALFHFVPEDFEGTLN